MRLQVVATQPQPGRQRRGAGLATDAAGDLATRMHRQAAERGGNTLDLFAARLRWTWSERFIGTQRGLDWRIDGAAA